MKLKTAFLPALALALALPALTSPARAQAVAGAPAYVDYQGMVFDGTTTDKPLGSSGTTGNYTAAPTNYTMQFKIYDSQSAGTLIWAETQTVTVSLGAFSVRLGSGASISGLSPAPTQTSIAAAFNGKDRYLELTVIVPPSSTGTPITPRLAFQSSPFSFVAQRAVLADTATLASSVNGVVTATTGSSFTGNGAGLTGLTAGQIPSLDAGKITTGIFATARIPNLDASKITTGTFSIARIPNLNASWITAGTLPIARGGTGSSTQNFVDLSNTQTIGGVKRFSSNVSIGTRWPNSKLDVQGNVCIGDGYAGWSDIAAPANGMIVQGNVGIGTTVPAKGKLHVSGSQTIATGSHSYYNAAHTSSSSNSISSTISIYASHDILAGVFRAFSDARIKRIEGLSDGGQDLTTLLGIEVTDYSYIDSVAKSAAEQKKVIAQQVEKVFPQAVSKLTDVVPDIYRKATIKDGWVNLATDLKKGERVRLIGEKEEGIHEVLEVRDGAFRTAFQPEADQVFVYGREVDDFRTVDYDAISMLNVSATQQIKKEKDAEVKALQEENRALRASLAAQDKRLASLEAKDKARDAKFARFEKLLDSTAELQPVTTGLSRTR